MLVDIWGEPGFERGCFSYFQNMVVEGEQYAFVERPAPGQTRVRCWAEKADGTPVLEASASIGAAPGESLLYERMAKLRAPEKLVILSDLHVGMKGAVDEKVRMDPDQNMGKLYPFSLNQKLAGITENSPWYSDGSRTPWGRAVIPTEMVSVLAEYQQRRRIPGQAAGHRPVRRPGNPHDRRPAAGR